MTQLTEAQFLRDIKNHIMEIIRDDGAARHIRFRKPGTMCMHFDLITWPDYLCYTGDMGTYVFRRLTDMFEFFRTGREYKKRDGAQLAINLSYWGEKLESVDRCDGYREFSEERFKANVMHWVEMLGLNGKLGHGLRDELEQDVFASVEYGRDAAYKAITEFTYDGKEIFTDFWGTDSDDYSFRFVWCCFALAWGIEQYDNIKISGEVTA